MYATLILCAARNYIPCASARNNTSLAVVFRERMSGASVADEHVVQRQAMVKSCDAQAQAHTSVQRHAEHKTDTQKNNQN